MKQEQIVSFYKTAFIVVVLSLIAGAFFLLGVYFSADVSFADDGRRNSPRVVFPKKTLLDFEGLQIDGELKKPGEFYFRYRAQEKFDSLISRRKNFHREMLRDTVQSR